MRITLEVWLQRTYDPECRPSLKQARSWARNKKLDPPAVKEGRSWYVEPYARYNDGSTSTTKPSVLERLRAETEGQGASRSA